MVFNSNSKLGEAVNLLDAIDQTLRANGKNADAPFGGVQMIFFGDFFQLPPVVTSQTEHAFFANEYGTPWFFSANAFKYPKFQCEIIEPGKPQTE